MLEVILMATTIIIVNIATVFITVYKLAKKYKRPWQVVLKRLALRTKHEYVSISKEK
tara:strand:- start:14285 stop:14455 length:171 start_codon:yes stop_codon:yes gene_type:complete